MINYRNDFDTEELNQFESDSNTPIFDESVIQYRIPPITINSSEEEKFLVNGQKQFLNKKRNDQLNKRNKNPHTKYSYDNLKRECKHLVIENAMSFVNKKIFEAYNGNIGEGILEKKLFKLNQNQKKNSNAEFNQQFIKKTLKEILSEKITKRIKYYHEDHNKRVIEKVLEEKKDKFEKLFNITFIDKRVIEKVLEEKKDKFEKLFNITFIDCLNHFIGKKKIDELNGFTLFNELKKSIIEKYKNEGAYYYENLEIFLKEFEKRINDSKPRKKSLDNK